MALSVVGFSVCVSFGCSMPKKDNKYRKRMREYMSPSPPPPPPRGKDVRAAVRPTTGDTARPARDEQVYEFSFLDRAGLVKVASEQSAKVSVRPDTPFP